VPNSVVTDLVVWLESTALSHFMNWSSWAWPIAESLHFVGLTMLFGTIGVFDLRLLGVGRGLEPAALHKLVPWGIAGFGLSMATGTLFLFGIPSLYVTNPAFQFKVLFLALAGLNVLFYYRFAAQGVARLSADDEIPKVARWVGGLSLALWISVLCAGRLIGFYKP
jgi:hypothetical protein